MENTRSVKEMFDDISGTYDLMNRLLSFHTDKRWRRKAVSLLPHGEGLKVLDLASGTLDLALQYIQGGPGEVYCLDFSLNMLTEGRNKVSPTLDSRLHLVCADGLTLPFPNAHWDAAMCAYGMRNLPDNRTALKELHRTLKTGAPLVILEFFKPTRPFSKIFAKTYGQFVMPLVGGWIAKDKEAYRYLFRSVQNFYTAKGYQLLLEEEGFCVERVQPLSGGISFLILAKRLEPLMRGLL